MSGTQYKPLTEETGRRRLCCSTILATAGMGAVIFLVTLLFWQYCFSGDPSMVQVNNGAGQHLYPPPPPHTEYARVARYIIHVSDWASLATVSTHNGIEGYPFDNVFSISDGIGSTNSSGTPYFYLTPIELSVKDLSKDPRASLTASLAQSSFCHDNQLDPQDPRCSHVILTGEIVKLKTGTPEAEFARTSLFQRHPEMLTWPRDHDWFFARLAIRHIYLLDYFGGAKVIAPEDYYTASPTQHNN